jgi:hypothetical protein
MAETTRVPLGWLSVLLGLAVLAGAAIWLVGKAR